MGWRVIRLVLRGSCLECKHYHQQSNPESWHLIIYNFPSKNKYTDFFISVLNPLYIYFTLFYIWDKVKQMIERCKKDVKRIPCSAFEEFEKVG